MKGSPKVNRLDAARERDDGCLGNAGSGWSLIREIGVDYLPSAQERADRSLRFPVYAERGPDGTFLIVDDLSVGKYLAQSTRCKTVRIEADGTLLYDSSAAGMSDAYGCFVDGGRIALIGRSGSDLTIVSDTGAMDERIELSSFSKGMPRLIRWTWKKTFLIQFIIRTGQIDIVEISPSGQLIWYLPRHSTLDLGFPGSIELLKNDHLLLIDEFHHVALEVSRDGRVLWSHGRRDYPSRQLDCLANPKSVCDGGDGYRLVADTRNHRILRIAQDGSVDEIRTPGDSFCSPSFIGQSGDRGLLICDAGNRRVVEIDSGGRTIWQFGPALAKGRCFSFPRSVEIFEGGYLVADTANDRVLHVAAGGEPREICSRETAGLFWPRCVRSLASGSFLIADARNSRIIEVSREGEIMKELGAAEFPKDLELRDPHDVHLLETGHLLLVDATTQLVIECDWSAAIYRVIGGGDSAVSLRDPHSVQTLPNGHLLICDTLNNRIIRLDDDGLIVKEFEAFRGSSGLLRLRRPRHVDCSADGVMIVADSDNNRVAAATLQGDLLWEVDHIPGSPLSYIDQPRWVHAISTDEIVISDHHHHRIVHLGRG